MSRKINLIVLCLLITVIVRAQRDSIPNVEKLLSLSLEELMNIKVVSASGYLQTTSEAPATITVISSQQIQERGYEQLEDALRDVPGIDMIHINGYAPTLFYFRGMYGAENLRALLMIDGIVENNILGSNDLAGPAYSLHNVDRIEIIWGPVSALYGANAFGGVINIISKKGADMDGLHVEQGLGSFNTSFEKISFGLRKANLEFSAAGTLYNTDGPKFRNRDPEYSGAYVHNARSFNGALSYYSKTSKTTLGYRTYRTPMGWGTYSNSPTVYLRLPPQGNGNSGIVGIVQRNFRGERSGLDEPFDRTLFLQNEFKPNKKFDMLTRVVFRETGHSGDGYVYVTANGTRMIYTKVASYSKRMTGAFSFNYSPAKKHKISAGVQYDRDNVERGARGVTFDLTTIYLIDGRDTVVNLNASFLPRKYDIRTNFGGYAQYILSTDALGKTDITLGFRYDHNSYFGNAFSPRIAVVNQPNDKLTFKLQFGTAFRAPTNLEIYQTPGGNFHIKPEKLRSYEVTAIYIPSDKFRAEINAFRNELDDVVVLSNLSGTNINKNPAQHRVNGATAILDLIITNNVSGYINFTFQNTTFKNLQTGTSGKLPAIADVKGNAGIKYVLNDLITICVSGNAVGERRAQGTNPYGPIPGYFLTNVTLTTSKLFNNRITASLAVHNIFNMRWLDPGFRTADGVLYSTVLEQPGINGLFKIGIDL